MEPQSYPPADDEQPAPASQAHPRSRLRLAAVVTTTALLAGVGGVGVGYVASRGLGDGSAASGQQGEARPVPGSGWSLSDGSRWYDVPMPVDPFGEGSGPGQGTGQARVDSQKASASQLTGLVRIVSTAKYSGSLGVGTGMVLTPPARWSRTTTWSKARRA